MSSSQSQDQFCRLSDQQDNQIRFRNFQSEKYYFNNNQTEYGSNHLQIEQQANNKQQIKDKSKLKLFNFSNQPYSSKTHSYIQAENQKQQQNSSRFTGVEPPRQLPKRSYSLEPDMINGWKPKRSLNIPLNQKNILNVFPLNCQSKLVDNLIKQIYKRRGAYQQYLQNLNNQIKIPFNNKFPSNSSSVFYQLVFLGPRYQNSYQLHEYHKNSYPNPYPISKKLDVYQSQRPGIPLNWKYENPVKVFNYQQRKDKQFQQNISQQQKEKKQINYNHINSKNFNLRFNSNFQCGNLDAAIAIHNQQKSNKSEKVIKSLKQSQKIKQFDLFMRVDTNTKGHTNWYYFTVENFNYVGNVRFNICNFRRQKSLYQRGLKPYCNSKRYPNLSDESQSWNQQGFDIKYQKSSIIFLNRYKKIFQQLYESQIQSQKDFQSIFKTYITLSFTYNFQKQNDLVELAYCIPYSYSKMTKFIDNLGEMQNQPRKLPPLKSLGGLSIPILQVTDTQIEQHNKKVILITGRIHPGQSNGSYIMQGFIEHICSSLESAIQFRKNYITYIIPMINPDGVVAGNYRTSLFGKDLNRTFNQTRRFAFPQTFHLLQFIKSLKTRYKQRFNIFIDLHGHSVKKNIFMYGPQFSLNQQPQLYYLSKQLPRILSDLTSFFRYYSCIFKISSQKAKTARGILNKQLGIMFTYTMQCSNSGYYDRESKKQFQFNIKKFKKMGVYLIQGLNKFKISLESGGFGNWNHNISNSSNNLKKKKQNRKQSSQQVEKNSKISHKEVIQQIQENQLKIDSEIFQIINQTSNNIQQNCQEQQKQQIYKDANNIENNQLYLNQFFSKQQLQFKRQWKQPQNEFPQQDDQISQGKSDSEPQDQDLSQNQLNKLLQTIQQGQIQDQNQHQFNYNYSLGLISQVQNLTQNNQVMKGVEKKTTDSKQKDRYKKRNIYLPPINCLNRTKQRANTNKIYLQPIASSSSSVKINQQNNINNSSLITTNNIAIISPVKIKQRTKDKHIKSSINNSTNSTRNVGSTTKNQSMAITTTYHLLSGQQSSSNNQKATKTFYNQLNLQEMIHTMPLSVDQFVDPNIFLKKQSPNGKIKSNLFIIHIFQTDLIALKNLKDEKIGAYNNNSPKRNNNINSTNTIMNINSYSNSNNCINFNLTNSHTSGLKVQSSHFVNPSSQPNFFNNNSNNAQKIINYQNYQTFKKKNNVYNKIQQYNTSNNNNIFNLNPYKLNSSSNMNTSYSNSTKK